MKKLFFYAFAPAALLSCLVFAACGDDDDDTTEPAEQCEAIAELCHTSSSPDGQECHENAEGTWSAAECTEHTAECVALCTPDAGE